MIPMIWNATTWIFTSAMARPQYPEHVHTKLFLDRVSPMAAPDFSGSLTDGPFIEIDWGPSFANGPQWQRWFVHHGLDLPKPAMIFASNSSIALTLAQTGAGIVLGQHALAQGAIDDGTLQILDQRSLPLHNTYYAISGHHQQNNKRFQTVLRALQKRALVADILQRAPFNGCQHGIVTCIANHIGGNGGVRTAIQIGMAGKMRHQPAFDPHVYLSAF